MSLSAVLVAGPTVTQNSPIVDALILSGAIRDRSVVFRNYAEFWKFLAPANFRGAGPQKLVPTFSCLAAHHVEKFNRVIRTDTKVIGLNTLNFKPVLVLFTRHSCAARHC